MLYVSLERLAPDLFDIVSHNVTTVNLYTKLCGYDNRRAFLFVSCFPFPAIANPQLRIGGDAPTNPVIPISNPSVFRESWWTIGKAITQELWLGEIGAGNTLNVTEIITIVKKARNSHALDARLRQVEFEIKNITNSTTSGRAICGNVPRKSRKNRFIDNV